MTGYPFADAALLEATVRRSARLERLGAGIILLVTMSAFWVWWSDYSAEYLWISVAIFLVSLWVYWPDNEMDGAVLVEHAAERLLGDHSRADLIEAVDEVRRSYRESEVPRLFIVDSPHAITMAHNASVFNFVPQWNAIWVSSYLLNALTLDELKSVIAHEMCHYSQHTTFWSRYFFLYPVIAATLVSSAFTAVIDLTGFLDDGVGVETLIWVGLVVFFCSGLTVALALANLVVMSVSWLMNRGDSHAIESLCDLEGAKRYGSINMVNALLKVATRSEIMTRAILAFSANPMLPFGGAVEAVGELDEGEEITDLDRQKLAAIAALQYLDENLPHTFLSEEDANFFIDMAIEHGLSEMEGARRHEHAGRRFIRWLRFDTRIKDSRLDREEFGAFVKQVRQASETPLFAIPEEVDAELEQAAEHPSIRHRILFLDHNFQRGLIS